MAPIVSGIFDDPCNAGLRMWNEDRGRVEWILYCRMRFVMWHGERNTFCMIFWCKSCAAFFVEPDNGMDVSSCSPREICAVRSPLGMFRVAIPTHPHPERPRHEVRKTMYRRSVRHVSQRGLDGSAAKNLSSCANPLCANRLRYIAENGVFPPNASVVDKNHVDFNIDCRHNSGLSYIGGDNEHTCICAQTRSLGFAA